MTNIYTNAKNIKKELDAYVMGQEKGTRAISMAIAQHLMQNQNKFPSDLLQTDNVLLVGPTGCGKTESFRTLQKLEQEFQCPVCMFNILDYSATKSWQGEAISKIFSDVFNRSVDLYFDIGLIADTPEEQKEDIIAIANRAIILLDEFDKIAIDSDSEGKSRQFLKEYQSNLLKVVEGNTYSVGNFTVPTADGEEKDSGEVILDSTHMMFIFLGAFSGIEEISLNIFSSNTTPSQKAIEAITRIAPHAYAPGKKLSRIFKAFCVGLGIADESPNSDFQRDFAQIADEMSSKKIPFKLFLSINPAHFITMSNPKNDNRGSCLTSCHSFNSTEYEYNNGCTGYARDSVTMIAFTASDPTNPETLNNRKTTRQLFMYEPGNGLLLQSRMYNTSGGTHGAQTESVLYRDLVQREISRCENAINLWDTCKYYGNNKGVAIEAHCEFGGYADWDYEEFNPVISIRKDHGENYHNFIVGRAGLCISCGEETENCDGLTCRSCRNHETFLCDCCGDRFPTDEAYAVYNEHGDTTQVCEDCLNRNYSICEDCECYYPCDCVHIVTDDDGRDRWVCEDCRDRNYEECDECEGYYAHTYVAYDRHGNSCDVCQTCLEEIYCHCEDCDDNYHQDYTTIVYGSNGYDRLVCNDCRDNHYTQCSHCGQFYHNDGIIDGLCPRCYEEKHADDNKKNDEVA